MTFSGVRFFSCCSQVSIYHFPLCGLAGRGWSAGVMQIVLPDVWGSCLSRSRLAASRSVAHRRWALSVALWAGRSWLFSVGSVCYATRCLGDPLSPFQDGHSVRQ